MPREKLPNVASEICTITVFCCAPSGSPIKFSFLSVTLTPVFNARSVIAIKRETEIIPNSVKVFAAFSLFGLRNAGTPFEIASTPVSALHPDENALANKNTSAIPAIDPCSVMVQSALSALRTFP